MHGKDVTEARIRGQLMGLTDVERHLARQYPAATRVAVDVVIPSDSIGHNGTLLVGFIHMDSPQDDMQNKNRVIFASPTIRSRENATTGLSTLQALPRFTVPGIVVFPS
ncbi:hypothetical protein N7491_003162 [Penicillium cf. griseofulvum]|uniref:Uncharacterized protein n=1 Tax=Penicillium cf. griseofulvum TaxID=2972120 RepID=A0A9W9MRN3_9EURO|nr:hypothetical protein N7472_002665 [Penicillium cf. griseofulvum]KAJ5440756.1 hypothetical protein N7491_003162 [Penicillium cf. griseofulvum]KAJ5448802.1 hypothetical protein N7445_003623 [Penicillium cf. griseofulvum]